MGNMGGIGMVKGESRNNITTVHKYEILKKYREQLQKTCGINLWHLNTLYIEKYKHTTHTRKQIIQIILLKRSITGITYKCSLIY